MAKIYGLFGSMQGKVADVVMAVRNGEQIVRKYQPIVSNPKSAAQVASRARLKLMSQLSAVMAPYIAIPRAGAVSTRNLFVKNNYQLSSYDNNQAEINLPSVKLTKSVVAFPALGGTRNGSTLNLGMPITEIDVNRVVYIVFAKTNNELRAVGSVVADNKGDQQNPWPAQLVVDTNDELVAYAYGVRDNTESASVKFGNMATVTAESIAKLVVSRVLTENDVTLTDTVSKTFPLVTPGQ